MLIDALELGPGEIIRVPGIKLSRLDCPGFGSLGRRYELRPVTTAHFDALFAVMRPLIQRDRVVQIWARDRLAAVGVVTLVDAYLAAHAHRSPYPPDWADLWTLWHDVTTHRPGQVLELGSGLSTVVLAAALAEVGPDGRLIAYEADAKWAAMNAAALPSALRDRAAIVTPPVIEVMVGTKRTMAFRPPEARPDYVYLDGSPEGAKFLGGETVLALGLAPGARVRLDARDKALVAFSTDSRTWRGFVQSVVLSSPPLFAGHAFGLDQYATGLLVAG